MVWWARACGAVRCCVPVVRGVCALCGWLVYARVIVFVCMHVWLYVCMFVCMHVCMYVWLWV